MDKDIQKAVDSIRNHGIYSEAGKLAGKNLGEAMKSCRKGYDGKWL